MAKRFKIEDAVKGIVDGFRGKDWFVACGVSETKGEPSIVLYVTPKKYAKWDCKRGIVCGFLLEVKKMAKPKPATV